MNELRMVGDIQQMGKGPMEVKYGQSGAAYIKFMMAIIEVGMNGQAHVCKYAITAFGDVAKEVVRLGHGTRVKMLGKIRNTKRQGTDGNPTYSLDVIVEKIAADTSVIQKAVQQSMTAGLPNAADSIKMPQKTNSNDVLPF